MAEDSDPVGRSARGRPHLQGRARQAAQLLDRASDVGYLDAILGLVEQTPANGATLAPRPDEHDDRPCGAGHRGAVSAAARCGAVTRVSSPSPRPQRIDAGATGARRRGSDVDDRDACPRRPDA